MGKLISLSFDDGRADTFYNVVPIIEKYGLKITVNIISDFIINPEKYTLSCCQNGSMTLDNLFYLEQRGHEISAHGATHKNDVNDIKKCVFDLNSWGIDVSNIGFASPHSYINKNNVKDVLNLVNNGTISYIRTGIQTRKEGIVYSVLTYIERHVHSKKLFYMLNKRSIITSAKEKVFCSVTVANTTTLDEIQYMIKKMPNDSSIIFNFHSVLRKTDSGYGEGTWYWDIEKFENLCVFLYDSNDIEVLTTRDLIAR